METLYASWPAMVIAAGIRGFQGTFLIVWFLRLPGTVVHEMLHWLVGVAFAAQPSKMSLWPQRELGGYSLGHVMFMNIRWFNGVFVGLAPLLGLGIFWWMGKYIQDGGLTMLWQLVAAWYAMGCLLLSSWPSRADWRIALHSWPMVIIVGAGYYFLDWKVLRTFV